MLHVPSMGGESQRKIPVRIDIRYWAHLIEKNKLIKCMSSVMHKVNVSTISGLAKHTGISVVWQSILVVTQRHCVNGLLPGHQLVGIQSTGQ